MLLAVYTVATLIQLAGLPAIVDSAQDLLDGTITFEQFEDDSPRTAWPACSCSPRSSR